jgi:FkbM family methyltransferase
MAPQFTVPFKVHPRGLHDPIYLRLGDSDLKVFEEIFFHEEYARVAKWELPPDATILDLGANIGIASLYFDAMYPHCNLIAVEPDAANCRIMRRNCRRMIQENRLRIRRAFVAESNGIAGLEKNTDRLLCPAEGVRHSWAFAKTTAMDAKHRWVRCISIPTLLKEAAIDHVDLLKCDIEGSEQEVFRACSPWISVVRHLVVETHNSWSNPAVKYPVAQLYRDLRAAGWDFDVLYELQEEFVGIAFLRKTHRP